MGVLSARSTVSPWEHEETLASDTGASHAGRPGIVFRHLTAADRPAIEAHFLALSPADRHSRFHALIGNAAILEYAGRIDFGRMMLVGAVNRATGTIVGLAEAHLDDALAPHIAEVSVSVQAGHRGNSIGRRLVAHALVLAAKRGARDAEFHYQTGNRAIAHLIRAIGPTKARRPGFATVSLPLSPQADHRSAA